MKSEDFLSRNIAGFTRALESVITAEDLSHAPGLLQGLDARVKIITLVLFMVVVGLAQSLAVLGAIFVMALALNVLSKVPTGFFLKRLLLFMPLFTALIAVPALFITPGTTLARLGGIVITDTGARAAGLLVLRVTDSLSFGLLLVLSTPWKDLLLALRWLRVPSLIVAVLGMTYRYIFVLLHSANAMFLGRRSRTIGGFTAAENRRWLGRALATTLARSQQLGDEVYLAMLSRGYHGEVLALNTSSFRLRDLFWLAFAVVAAWLLLWSNAR